MKIMYVINVLYYTFSTLNCKYRTYGSFYRIQHQFKMHFNLWLKILIRRDVLKLSSVYIKNKTNNSNKNILIYANKIYSFILSPIFLLNINTSLKIYHVEK